MHHGEILMTPMRATMTGRGLIRTMNKRSSASASPKIGDPFYRKKRMPKKGTCHAPNLRRIQSPKCKKLFSENKDAPKRDMHPRQTRRRQSPKCKKLFSENNDAQKRDMQAPFCAFLAPTSIIGVCGVRMPPYHICSHKNASKKVPQIT